MKSLILIISALSIANAQTPATPTDQIKSCLASIYIAQTDFQKKHASYANQIENLELKPAKPCEGVKFKFANVTAKTFTVTANLGKEAWSVDDSKTMKLLTNHK